MGSDKYDERALYVLRETILGLLSDSELAAVDSAETAGGLADGEEYLDLGAPEGGVRRAPAASAPIGRVLPRKAVDEATWSRILAELPAPDPG